MGTLAKLLSVSTTYIHAALKLSPNQRLAVVHRERPLIAPKAPLPWKVRAEQLVAEVGVERLANWVCWRKAMTVPTAAVYEPAA